MKTTQQHFVEKPDLLAVNHLWQAFFMPFYPILADICQESIPMVKKSVPVMLDIIACQLLKQTTPSQTKTFQPLPSFLKDDKLAGLSLQNMHSFQALKQIEPYQNKFFEQLFDETQRPIIVGFLLAKTPLNKVKIEVLLIWTSFLAIKLLHDFCSPSRQSALSETQLTQWRKYQLFALASPEILKVWQLVDFKNKFSVTYNQQQAILLAKQPQMQEILQNIWQFMQDNHLIDIGYKENNTSLTKDNAVLTKTQTTQINPSTKDDDITELFSPKVIKKLSCLDYLQKYWIATGVVLSGLVFGAMNFIMPDKSHTTAQTVQSNDKKANTTQPKNYHDVAIVKVASVPTTQDINDTNKAEKQPDTNNVKAEITPSKSDEKKSADIEKKPVSKKDNEKKEREKKAKEKIEKPTEKKVTKDKKTDDNKKVDRKAKDEKAEKRPRDEKERKKVAEKSVKEKKSVEKPKKTENKKVEPKKAQPKQQEESKVVVNDDET